MRRAVKASKTVASRGEADFFREIFAALADGVIVIDANAHVIEVNDAFCRMVGFARLELLGVGPPFPFWPTEELPTILPAFRRALEGSRDDLQVTLCRSGGERFPAFVHPGMIGPSAGAGKCFVAVVKDASEQKRMERALMCSEERWRSIAENPYDYVAIFGPDYRYEYVNHTAPGIEADDIIGRATPFDFVDPSQHRVLRSAFERSFREGVVSTYECYVPSTHCWYSNVVTPIKENGKVVAVSVLTRDITAQKHALDALRENERRLQLVLSAGDLGSLECDLVSGSWTFSPRVCELWGYPPGSPEMPRDLADFFSRVHPDDLPSVKNALLATMQGGEPFRAEYRIRRASGEYLWIEGRARTFSEAGGSPHLYGVIADISARKRAEEEHERMETQLRHAQKMDTLGTLAGGIAHDFNNILMPILGNAELLLARLGEGALADRADAIVKAALRAQELVGRILVFGRPGDEQKERVHIPTLAHEALRLLSTSLPSSVALATEIDESCPQVWGSPGQIHQAILNVGTNAYQALRGSGGRLTVRVSQVQVDEPLQQAQGIPGGKAVKVAVQDDGPGIPDELQERIFEPFFTTKRVGEGTGLGLALVHSIMKSHGGAVTVRSEVGRGALFELFFPVLDTEELVRRAPTRAPARSQECFLRILCVDDDVAVLTALDAMLTHTGHCVTSVASAQDALLKLRDGPDAYDLVVTDYTMPHLNGLEFARGVQALRPDLPVILISGYAEVSSEDEVPANVRSMLRKPMTLDAFLDAVQLVSDELGKR